MENPKFVLKKSDDKQYYFTLQAANGQTLITSETYTTKENAFNGIEATANCAFDCIFPPTICQDKISRDYIKIDDQTGEA